MVVVNSDDEEERKHLLSQDSSPLKVQNGDNIVKNQLLPRLAWHEEMEEESNKEQLRLGPAEQQFLAMAGSATETGEDCLLVVSNILSQLDQDNNREASSVVVDVHQAGRGEVRQSLDRVSRGTSEASDRQRSAEEQLHNCDRIETVGEERARHMSESAAGPLHWTAGRRKRAATLGCEVRVVRQSSTAGQTVLDMMKHCSSTEKLGDHQHAAGAAGGGGGGGVPVKFDIWEEADQEQGASIGPGDNCDQYLLTGDSIDSLYVGHHGKENDLDCSFQFTQHPLVTELYSGCSSNNRQTGCMSHSSSTSSMPICRICQLPSIEPHNSLISPCRCLGSIRYVHNPCLAKWLEVCSKKTGEPPVCELCQYQYIRHKKFVISNWRVPSISSRDSVLHAIFLLSILIMIICSVATILSFRQSADTLPKVGPDTELSTSELLTLSCGVLFFLSFFVAMYVEVKASDTIYQLICKFFQMNHEWTILEYDRTRDRDKTDSENVAKAGFP